MRNRAFAVGPALASSLWGGMYVVSKWGFASIPPVTLSFLRLLLGAVTLLLIVRVTAPARVFTRREWGRFAGLGGLVALTILTQFIGTDLTSASQGALLTVLTPVFTLILGVAIFGEPFTRRKLFGMGVAALGTGLVFVSRYDITTIPTHNLLGVGCLLLASIGWAGYTVWGKPLVRRYSALEAATYSTMFAVPLVGVLVPFEFALRNSSLASIHVTGPVIGAVLYLGVLSTAVAWYAWYKGLEFTDSGTVAVFFFAQPVVGTVLGVLVLGESLGLGFLIGGVVMLSGIFLVSSARSD